MRENKSGFDGMKSPKRKMILWALVVMCLFLVGIQRQINNANRNRMLQAVGLEYSSGLSQVDYTCWRDPLEYGDGYEVMAFAVEGSVWNPPENWVREERGMPVDEIADQLGISLNMNAVLKLSLGGENGQSWVFVDNRANDLFEEQDFYFAYSDETYSNSVIVFVYRGHHLYGL